MNLITYYYRIYVVSITTTALFCLSFSLAAQEKTNIYDSLYNIFITSNYDSLKTDALINLADFMEMDSTISYNGKTNDEYLQLANQISKDSISINFLAHRVDKIGVKYRNNGNYISALKFHNWAKDIVIRIDDKNMLSIINNNIGVTYRRLDDYQTALKYHIQALQLAEETRNIRSQAIAINSIGNIQMMIGNLNVSLEYFKQSLILEQKQKNLLGIAINLNNIGNVYSEKKELVKALEYYFLSLDVNNEIGSKKGVAICYNDIGNIYEDKKEFSKALVYYLDAFKINSNLDNKNGLAYSYLQIGELYTDMGQYSKALDYLLPGLIISKEIGAKAFIKDIYNALYLINRAQKNYEQAFEYLHLSNRYNDSIININVRKDIARLQVKFESERKENHIALLEQNLEIAELDIKRKRFINLFSISAFFIALILIIFLSYYIFNKNKTNKLLLERNKIIENTRAELDNYSKQLLKAKQEAERNSKTKGEFLANMSHEIRTPLNSVIGFADLLSDSVNDEQQLSYLKTIKSSGRTLLKLINDILDLSKIEAGKFKIDYEDIIIDHIFEDIRQIFSQRTIEKNLDLNINISPELPNTIFFSELRLRQILFNLVGNAIKFTTRGSITIEAYSKPIESSNEINLFINITDTGIGIPEHELNIIFEPFNQSEANQSNQGTGLGLAITKRLVELMNGSIEVVSQEMVGSKFLIQFPNLKVVENFSSTENRANKVGLKNEFVNILLFTKNIDKCNVNDIELINNYTNYVVDNIEEAKTIIKNKNIVIICGLSYENSKNTFNALRKFESIPKLNFIVLSNSKNENKETDSKLIWLTSSRSSKEFAKVLVNMSNKIAVEERTDIYFNDMLNINTTIEFNKDIDLVYSRYFKPALKTKMSGTIISFINSLTQTAKTHNNWGLIEYCNELNKMVVNFDIEEIDKLLDLFKANYKKKNK